MSTLINIVVFLAAWHLVCENILGPTMRQGLRYRVFALRDELRLASADGRDGLSPEVFEILQDTLNGALVSLASLRPSVLMNFRRACREDAELRARITYREATLAKSGSPIVQRIESELARILQRAFLANCIGWLVYIVPLAIAMWALTRFRLAIKRLIFLSEGEAVRLSQDEMIGRDGPVPV